MLLDPAIIDPDATRAPETLRSADYQRVAREALGELFPNVTSRSDLRALYALLSLVGGFGGAGAGWFLASWVRDSAA